MFTVVFAEKETIKLFEETKMFFGQMYNSDKIAFCEWDKEAVDLEAMAPGLYDLIEYQNEWRALILYDDGTEQLNPFDFTMYSEPFYSKRLTDWQTLKNRRVQRIAAYDNAVSNPLVKLTTALCGMPNFKSAIADDEYKALLSGEKPTYAYMLEKQLGVLNCNEIAVRFDRFQRDALKKFVSEDKVDQLIAFVKDADASGIISLISDMDIIEFIRYIGNDPIYYDPEYTECLIESIYKTKLLENIAEDFSMKDKLPSEVICFSPRTFDFEKVEQDIKWKKKDESSSSRFTDFNLYNDKLKFILFDILPKDNKQFKFDQIKLLCLLLILAGNEAPKGLISANHVYRVEINFNDDIVTKLCEKYISKLRATQVRLKEIELQLEYEKVTSVDDNTARTLFESDIEIPVKIISSENNESSLYAEYNALGLSTDCPEEERIYWARQYREISKRFIRYLREPRRAVKAAITNDFRKNNSIDDDRTLFLTENQVEDVNFHLAEEEQRMVETTTTHLFDTKKFNEELAEADKQVKRAISQRMTKKKTVVTALIAIAAYFIGFLPLIFSNLNTVKSFLFSLSVAGITIGVFAIIGFIYLFVLRHKLVNRFKHFNYVMGGICSGISAALAQFSHYLSHACNVMRDFSVLKNRDSTVTKTKRILVYHNMKVSEQIKNVHEMFSKYVDLNKIGIKESEPYNFDYTVMREYEYEMPSIYLNKRIEYLQKGNEIVIPVDYVDSITLIREELYD